MRQLPASQSAAHGVLHTALSQQLGEVLGTLNGGGTNQNWLARRNVLSDVIDKATQMPRAISEDEKKIILENALVKLDA